MLKSIDKIEIAPNQPWYSSWFNEEIYDRVYNHRSQDEAKIAVKLLRDLISQYEEGIKGEYILDVACGNCRHLPYLKDISDKIIGLDLSFRQLKNGAHTLSQSQISMSKQLLRADMKSLPIKENSLSLITNFFTSFGYFNCDLEHQNTLTNWASTLKNGGLLFIDLLNKSYIIDSLSPFTNSQFDCYSIEQYRNISKDNKRVEKRITIRLGEKYQVFNESVRLFSLDELTQMLNLSGLKIVEINGSYNGEDYKHTSERLIVLAQKI